MDLTKFRDKLVGSDEERAVSPVIGVILMVAITVILAAVIAAFVMDIGDELGDSQVNAAVNSDVSNSDEEVQLTIDSDGSAEQIILRGDLNQSQYEWDDVRTGETLTLVENGTAGGVDILDDEEGSVNIVAADGDAESNIGSFDWDWS